MLEVQCQKSYARNTLSNYWVIAKTQSQKRNCKNAIAKIVVSCKKDSKMKKKVLSKKDSKI